MLDKHWKKIDKIFSKIVLKSHWEIFKNLKFTKKVILNNNYARKNLKRNFVITERNKKKI